MTDEQIVIEIAKLDGWELDSHPNFTRYWRKISTGSGCGQEYFRYLTSRDAIIPVIEKAITNPEIEKTFNYTLYDILEREQVSDTHAFTYVMAVFATARQLAIALLKTKGKWTE